MSAHTFNDDWFESLDLEFAVVNDPGDGETIQFERQGLTICRVTTAGAETRVVEDADNFPVGTLLLVTLESAGDLTIDTDDTDVVLADAGDVCLFVVGHNGTNKVWRAIGFDSTSILAELNAIETYLERAVLVAIPYTDFRVFDAQTTVLPVYADDDSDDIQIGVATIGTTAPTFAIGVTNATVTKNMVVNAVVPTSYVAGSAISIVVPWTRSDAAGTSSALDLVAYRHAAPTVDINSTAAQSINGAASGTATFVLTPTDVVPGETILLHFTAAVVDNGTSRQDLTSVNWSFTPVAAA